MATMISVCMPCAAGRVAARWECRQCYTLLCDHLAEQQEVIDGRATAVCAGCRRRNRQFQQAKARRNG